VVSRLNVAGRITFSFYRALIPPKRFYLWHAALAVAEKEGYMRAFASVMILGLTVVAAQAIPLTIVEVSAPKINCTFDTDCQIVVDDTTDLFTLPTTTGDAFLQSRRFPPGEAGTVAAGLYAYLYRLDLRKLAGVTAVPCIHTLSFDFGPVVPLDYDGNQEPDHVFVITKGGVGTIAPAEAEQVGDTITLYFKPSVCAGGSLDSGDSSFFFGLVSAHPPTAAVARVWDTLGTETVLDVQVPLQAVDVDCDAGDSLGRALQSIETGETLRITGVCKGEVTIPVDGVTLLGVGRTEIVGSSGQEAAITIAGRRNVVLKNLQVSNGSPGVFVQGSTSIVLDAVKAEQNTGSGFQFEAASSGLLTDCSTSHNGGHGIVVHERSRLRFFGDNLSSYNQENGITIISHADMLVGQVRDTPPQKRMPPQLSVVQRNALESTDLEAHAVAAATAARCDIKIVGNAKHGVLVSASGSFYVGPGCKFVSRKNGKDGIRFTGVSSGDFLEARTAMSQNSGSGMNVRGQSSVVVAGTSVKTIDNKAAGINVENASAMAIDTAGGSPINSQLCSRNNAGVGVAVSNLSFVSCGGGVATTLQPNVGGKANVSVDSLLTCAMTPVNACASPPEPR
jgi:hypothetical protein